MTKLSKQNLSTLDCLYSIGVKDMYKVKKVIFDNESSNDNEEMAFDDKNIFA